MIVCADDFGLAPDINRAVIELAEAGRVTAVSVMAALPSATSRDIRPLLELGGKIDLGLHLTLTLDKGAMPTRSSTLAPGGRFQPYGSLVFQTMSGQVNSSECSAEITAQYNLFVEKTGRTPDFIDGHKHVHQLAGIREGLLKFVMTLPKDGRPYIRNTNADFMEILKLRTSFIKQMVISTPGGVMKERLKSEGVLTNDGFAGI
ncbi:MAG: ChbG/HpnK family deacetylase [Nitrospinae bacterium]|nr:ChbG/HpnK family deacetylase [Nitrospinota bacterium]